MYGKVFLAEKLFALIILLYIFFAFRYRSQITSSKYYKKQYWKYQGFKKNLGEWYFDLDKKRMALRIVLVMVLVFSGYGVYARLNPEKRFHRLIDRCEVLVKDRKYEQAIIDMSNALKIRPDYIQGHYFLANLYVQTGQTGKAASALQHVIRHQPDYGNAVNMLKSILISQKDSQGLAKLAEQLSDKMPLQGKMLKATSLILDNQFEPALKILEEAGQIAPGDEKIYQLMGDLHILAGHKDKAIEAYQSAVKINFGLWQVHHSLANLYLEKGMTEHALSELRITRSLNPEFYLAAIKLAQIYYSKGYFEGAAQILEDVLEKNGGNEPAAYTLGIVYTALGRYQEAINRFTRLSASYQEQKSFRYNLALAYFHAEKYLDAQKWLDVLKASDGLDVYGRKLLARVYFELGKVKESADILRELAHEGVVDDKDLKILAMAEKERGRSPAEIQEKREIEVVRSKHTDLEAYLRNKDYNSLIKGARQALQENTIKAPFHNLLGVGYLATGDLEQAKTHFLLSYNEKKDNPMPLLNLTNVYMKTGSAKEAEDLLVAHNRMFPQSALTRLVLGEIYLRTGRLEEAVQLFKMVLDLNPQSFKAHQNLAVIYRLKGDIKSALDEYLKSINLNPNDAISLNDVANVYAEDKAHLDKALEYATRAVRIAPANGNFRDTLGWVYYRKGALQAALDNFKTALDLNPYLPTIPYHLGLAQFMLKQFDVAQQNLRLALSMPGQFQEADEARKLLEKISALHKPAKTSRPEAVK